MGNRNTFRLYDGDDEVAKFDDPTDAYDTDACKKLLVIRMIGKGIDPGRGRLDCYQNGRKTITVTA